MSKFNGWVISKSFGKEGMRAKNSKALHCPAVGSKKWSYWDGSKYKDAEQVIIKCNVHAEDHGTRHLGQFEHLSGVKVNKK